MPSLVILTAGENNGCLQAEALRQLRGEKKQKTRRVNQATAADLWTDSAFISRG